VNALTDIGATDVVVDRPKGEVNLNHDPTALTFEQIKNEIEEIGFAIAE